MPARLELAGQRFGRLQVVRREGKDKHGAWMWRCLSNTLVCRLRRGWSVDRALTKDVDPRVLLEIAQA